MLPYTIGFAGIVMVGLTIKKYNENMYKKESEKNSEKYYEKESFYKKRGELARQGGIISTDGTVKGKFFKKEYNQDYFKIMDNDNYYFERDGSYLRFTDGANRDKCGFCYDKFGYHSEFTRHPINMKNFMERYNPEKNHILKLNIEDDTEIFIESNGGLNVKDPSFVILDKIKTLDDFQKILDEKPYKAIPSLHPYWDADWIQKTRGTLWSR